MKGNIDIETSEGGTTIKVDLPSREDVIYLRQVA
jgi:hypothetical protein